MLIALTKQRRIYFEQRNTSETHMTYTEDIKNLIEESESIMKSEMFWKMHLEFLSDFIT